MKKGFLLLVAIGIVYLGFSQNQYFYLNSYNCSKQLILNARVSHQIIYSDYGHINSYTASNRYAFHSQEFDKDLDIVFYPSRIYSLREKRFIQPDPASQFFSPYLFLSADPVNHIDMDGNESVPFIVGTDDFNFGTGISDESADMIQAAGKSVHRNSLINFMEGKYRLGAWSGSSGRDFEWNGNVFIDAKVFDGEIEVFRAAPEVRAAKYKGSGTSIRKFGENKFMGTVEPETIGKKLHMLSLRYRKAVKNIFVTGDNGGEMAARIAGGYTRLAGDSKGVVNAIGLKPGRSLRSIGHNVTRGNLPLSTDFPASYIAPHSSKLDLDIELEPSRGEGAANNASKIEGIYTKEPLGVNIQLNHAGRQEVHDMIHEARVPDSMADDFGFFPIHY